MAIDKIIPGPKLDALTAEKVFGWKKIHQHDDRDGFYGKRQDKAGYWRLAKVPQYSTNFLNAYSIERRMEQLGRLDRYLRVQTKTEILFATSVQRNDQAVLPHSFDRGPTALIRGGPLRQLFRITHANNIPSQTSSLNQICYFPVLQSETLV